MDSGRTMLALALLAAAARDGPHAMPDILEATKSKLGKDLLPDADVDIVKAAKETLGVDLRSVLPDLFGPFTKIHITSDFLYPSYAINLEKIPLPVPLPSNCTTYWPGIRDCDSNIKYLGGPLMVQKPMNVHVLFYGDWSKNEGKDQDVITNFVQSLSDPSADDKGPSVKGWWDITPMYTDGAGNKVAPKVAMGKKKVWEGEYKKGLNDGFNDKPSDISSILMGEIAAGTFPEEAGAIYVLIPSPDVKVGNSADGYSGGYCDVYCGFHYFNDMGANKMTYAFIGNADACPKSCGLYNRNKGITPNGYFGMDMAASVLGHELTEAATDNYVTGWQTEKGWENGDLCAWVFTDYYKHKTLMKDENGAEFNMYGVNGYKYLVQTNACPEKQACLAQADSADAVF